MFGYAPFIHNFHLGCEFIYLKNNQKIYTIGPENHAATKKSQQKIFNILASQHFYLYFSISTNLIFIFLASSV